MTEDTRSLLDGMIKARQLLLQQGAPVDGLLIRIHPHDYMTLGLDKRGGIVDMDVHGAPATLMRMPFTQDSEVQIGAPIVERAKP